MVSYYKEVNKQHNTTQHNTTQHNTHLFELFNGCLFILFTLFGRSHHLLGYNLEINQLFFQGYLIAHDGKTHGKKKRERK
jgi:hypothetical protein